MSSNPGALLAGHPSSDYTQANASFAAPQLLLADKHQLFHKMGLEEESPAMDDLIKHISSTFLSQNNALDPAKAIISLLLGLSAQVNQLTSEVHTLSARHTADVTRLTTRINNSAPQNPPAPAPIPQVRPAVPRAPVPATRTSARSTPAKPVNRVPQLDGEEFVPNVHAETIDQNGNRRRLTYAEQAAQFHQSRGPAPKPAPVTRNAGPRTPSTPQAPKTNLPAAQRCFYATRTTPTPFKNHQQLEARLPSDLGRVLANAGFAHPHTSLQVQVNRNGTVTCTASPSTPAKDIAPYFPGLLEVLNLACNSSENPFNEFQLAPTNVDYAIHNVPMFALDVPESLFTPHIAEAVSLTTGATVARARFLSKPENRVGKTTTTIVISVLAEDTDKVGDQIRLFGRSRRCNKLWPASPNSLCRKCSRLGHATEGCQSSSPTCPLCAGNHLRKDHRCPNSVCPKEGNQRPVVECCATWKAKCINCDGNHIASFRECPARSTRARPTTSTAAPEPQNATSIPPPANPTQNPITQSTSVATTQQEGPVEEDQPMTN